MVLIIAVMTQIDSMRNAVYVLPVWLAVLYVGFLAKTRMEGRRAWTA
jgi:AAT family amino acid transporter/aromatic amino acid transport protein AroP